MKTVAVVGGGPAGMLSAIMAAKNGHRVTLFEKNEKLGKKLYITGKGRCNFTNSAEREAFFSNIPRNPKFLFSAFNFFNNTDIIQLIEGAGVPAKVERGGRVFPASDKSSDILKALLRQLDRIGVQTRLNTRVERLLVQEDKITGVVVLGKDLLFDAVVVCTGGLSYPQTGSTGDGYIFAQAFNHKIIPQTPSLVPLETVEQWPQLSGLSLRNVTLTVMQNGKVVYSELGELLFTHFGVSGPLVLSASSHIADKPEGARLLIDLKPGLDDSQLDRRMLRDFKEASRKQLKNSLDGLLPKSLIPLVIELSGVCGDKQTDQLTREERERIRKIIKELPLAVKKARPIEEAIITRGGVSVKDINPSTMESRKVKGLYFAGEIIDLDGYTGGFNLQIAFSTGALAGASI